MMATTSQRPDADRFLTAFAGSETAPGSFEDALRHHGTASAGARSRRTLGERFEAALARGERAAVDLVHRWRDRLDRRRTVGELRRMGRSRLADLGIEPNDIERVVDAMLAARRNVAAAKGGVARPQSG